MEESSDGKYFEGTKSDYDIRMGKYDYLVAASRFLIGEEQMMQSNSLKRDFQGMCDEDDDDTDSVHSECKKRKAMVEKNRIKKGTGGSLKIAKKKKRNALSNGSDHWLCNSCNYDYRG